MGLLTLVGLLVAGFARDYVAAGRDLARVLGRRGTTAEPGVSIRSAGGSGLGFERDTGCGVGARVGVRDRSYRISCSPLRISL